jgi:hypothetical protein
MTEMVAGKGLSCAHGNHILFSTSCSAFSKGQRAVFSGRDHERQRKIIAPAFFASQLKAFVPTFQDVASKVPFFKFWA